MVCELLTSTGEFAPGKRFGWARPWTLAADDVNDESGEATQEEQGEIEPESAALPGSETRAAGRKGDDEEDSDFEFDDLPADDEEADDADDLDEDFDDEEDDLDDDDDDDDEEIDDEDE